MSKSISPPEIIQQAFPGMGKRESQELAQTGDIRIYPANHVLCHDGATENIFYILLDGEVEVTKLISPTEARLLTHLGPGDFFGEMALIHDAPRAATVATISPATVLEINKTEFGELLKQNTSVLLAMVREVTRRLRENDEMAIDDLRFKAKELADAYQQLAEEDYTRQEFLTTIAHELRTPLTAAYGYLQTIQRGVLDSEDMDATLITISRNIQKVISLVNDILLLQEMDLILLEFEPVNIRTIVKTVVEQQRRRAERNDVTIVTSIAPGIPLIHGDEKRLERVFNIILDNAIKFSPDGGEVSIVVDFDEVYVWVKVIDNGVGIPNEALPRIFNRFFRLDEINGHLFSGAGLGLTIARQVIEQHGGKIDVHTELGEGSTFTVQLMVNK